MNYLGLFFLRFSILSPLVVVPLVFVEVYLLHSLL